MRRVKGRSGRQSMYRFQSLVEWWWFGWYIKYASINSTISVDVKGIYEPCSPFLVILFWLRYNGHQDSKENIQLVGNQRLVPEWTCSNCTNSKC